MKAVKTMKLAGVLFLFLGLGLFNQAKAQTTQWLFSDGAANPRVNGIFAGSI